VKNISGDILQKYWKLSAERMEFLPSLPKDSSIFSQINLQATHPFHIKYLIPSTSGFPL
jgi:hypothetical protein